MASLHFLTRHLLNVSTAIIPTYIQMTLRYIPALSSAASLIFATGSMFFAESNVA